jgi:hypothetical protein
MLGFMTMRYTEVHGHLPLMKGKKTAMIDSSPGNGSLESVVVRRVDEEKGEGEGGKKGVSEVHAVASERTIVETV